MEDCRRRKRRVIALAEKERKCKRFSNKLLKVGDKSKGR